MIDIEKKISEIEKELRSAKTDLDAVETLPVLAWLEWTLNQLKACRGKVQSYKEWIAGRGPECPMCGLAPKVIEQRTKEACFEKAKEWIRFNRNRLFVGWIKSFKQAVDSAEVSK